MSEYDLNRVEELFQAAADLPPAERITFLERSCGADTAVYDHVERLLARLDRDQTLGTPTPDNGGPLASITEGPGSIIGRYKLLQVIGEGGFGIVYMAEQQEPVVRKVALKIIKLGMDTREVVARFEAERQALAMMDHPNIARVLDGGATASGRPYFVMELVRGVAITEYCDRDDLGTQERLELFLDVCHAVQHAHQKGVIHRDLKPSNVLVTLHDDGRPIPKVIDFGVAKAMHARLTDKTLFTRYEQFIGTPVYMSPEQAEMSALDVDTRTDIYSLGVLLYELLTGSTPFDVDSMRRAGLAEIQRIIREEQPQRPSVRISTSTGVEVARHSRIDTTTLSRRLRGDLDWIVMKALEKERARRYATAGELADDIRRHLRDEPVLAGAPRAAYRARKFLARNRAAVLSAALVGLALVFGIVGTTAGMLKARHNEELIREQADHALQALSFLDSVLALSNPEVALDPDITVRTLLDHTAAECAEAFAGQPWAETRIRLTIGRAYEALGENELAEPHLRRVVEIVDQKTGGDLERFAWGGFDLGDFYTTLWSLTNVCFHLERPDAFEVARRARLVGFANIGARHPDLVVALRHFIEKIEAGAWTPEPDALDGVLDLFQEAVALSEARLPGGDPLWPIVADTFLTGGYEVWYTPHEPLAEQFFGQALAIQRRELPPDHPDISASVLLLVNILNKNGKAIEAEQLIRDSLEALRRVHDESGVHIASAESILGENLVAQGRYDDAAPYLLRSHEVIMAKGGGEQNWRGIESFIRVVRLFEAWGKPEDGRPYREGLARAASTGQSMFEWTYMRPCFEVEHTELVTLIDEIRELCGFSYLATPGTRDAPGLAEPARRLGPVRATLLDARAPRAAIVARMLVGWANSLEPEGNAEARRLMAAEAIEILRHWRAELPYALADALAIMASTSAALGDESAARREAAEAWRVLRSAERPGMWYVIAGYVRVARSLLEVGLYQEAEDLLLPSYETLTAQLGSGYVDTVLTRDLLHELYRRWGKPDQARQYEPNDAGA